MNRFFSTLVFLAGALYFAIFLFQSDGLLDLDGYYHIAITKKYLQNGLILSLPEMAETVQAERFVDAHFLFHVCLAPFLALFPPLIAWKLYLCVLFGLLSLSLATVLLLLKQGISQKEVLFWLFCFALASPVFTGRLLFGRASLLYNIVFLLTILALNRKSNLAAFIFSWLAVWSYPAFGLQGGLGILHFFQEMTRQMKQEASGFSWRILKQETLPLVATMSGLICGIVLHPGFPAQFAFYKLELFTFFQSPLLESIGEWQAPDTAIYARALFLPALLLLIALYARQIKWPAFLAITMFFIVLSARITKALEMTLLPLILFCSLQNLDWIKPASKRIIAALFIVLSTAYSLPLLYYGVKWQQERMDVSELQGVVSAIEALPPQTGREHIRIFAGWSEFPYLFYKLPGAIFPYGMNPVYAYGKSSARYAALRSFQNNGVSCKTALYEMPYNYFLLDNILHRDLIYCMGQISLPLYKNRRFTLFEAKPD